MKWPLLILTALLLGSCGCKHSADITLPSPLVIDVVGRDFLWTFTYPGADQVLGTEDDLVATKDLHLPMGLDVRLRLTSEDYIYTFRARELGLKEVAVPELYFELVFKTDRQGKYELEVDPLCAVQFLHDDEMGWLVIEDREAFNHWCLDVKNQENPGAGIR